MTTKEKEIEIEVMAEPEFKVQKFDPTHAELTKKKEEYQLLLDKEIDSKEQFEIVSSARKDCKATRVKIEKAGKAIRDEANKFAKKVIEKEKELKAILEQTEVDLLIKEEAYKKKAEIERRKKRYPNFAEKFKAIGYELTEDQYCNSDDAGIYALMTKIKQEKLDKERLEFEAKQAEIRAKEEAIAAREKELQEAEQKVKIEEARKLAAEKAAEQAKAEAERQHKLELAEQKAESERKLKEQKEAQEKEVAKKEMLAKAETVRKKKEEEAAKAKQEFLDWIKEIGFIEGQDVLQFDHDTQEHKAYRLIGTLKKSDVEEKEIEI